MVKLSKTKVMAQKPIYVDKIPVYSPLLIDIADLDNDIETYSQYINYFILRKEDLREEIKPKENIEGYDLILYLITTIMGFEEFFLKALFYFTKIEFKREYQIIYNDIVFQSAENEIDEPIELNRNNFDDFVKAIKYVTCVEVQDEVEMDEFDRLLAEREKVVLEAQNKGKEQPTFIDLVSAVANMKSNGLNIINIWQLNIYQFYEQLQRGQMAEQYHIAIQEILAGVNPDDIEVKSYFTKI